MTGDSFILKAGRLTLAELHRFWRGPQKITLDPAGYDALDRSAATVAAVVAEGRRVYGITTGFGSLARQTISADQVAELQTRLVLSHSCGVGAPLEERVVRLVLLLKINALSRGHSGIRRDVVDRLIRLLNDELYPVIPSQGSVGASGDLAPLAHLSAVLLGHGEITHKGRRRPAAEVLAEYGIEPIELAAKEGLALLNGTQVSTALALHGLFCTGDAFGAALTAGALSVDAALGSDTPFDPRIHELRGHPGQIAVAGWLRALLAGSEIRQSHLDCDRVQDPYSLRCQPQVMGAALDLLRNAATTLRREANAVSDNPLVFPGDGPNGGDVLSGGNFHAEPVAFAADTIALALAEIGALSERRIAMLTDATMSALPPFLVAEPGLNSGFMIAHVTAAALAAENKQLSHPASVDSLPTSANQEDHVSMATHGARRLAQMAANSARIVAVELLAGGQGIDLRRPLATSPGLNRAMVAIRDCAAFLDHDRALSGDIEKVAQMVEDGRFSGVFHGLAEDTAWFSGDL
ncbi:histidine ammonia-lyase [Pelagibius marinus]|uniref:histidine ammonia-lyase n=1 Tax=Pelagibius marinus TaxID=2762760 RepID=UPI0018723957|nr:histidine ammonia-lyase [Pelagibius marinus]